MVRGFSLQAVGQMLLGSAQNLGCTHLSFTLPLLTGNKGGARVLPASSGADGGGHAAPGRHCAGALACLRYAWATWKTELSCKPPTENVPTVPAAF